MNKLIIPVAALICLPAIFGCSRHGAQEPVPDLSGLPGNVAGVTVSLCDNDAAAFASMVRYPLERPYPLHDIVDSVAMVAYYHVMVDDSLRAMAARPDSAWSEYGWRGWAMGDGSVWVDDDGVYDVPYMSAAEKKRYDALVAEEMASLPPSMRDGYTPVGCWRDTAGPAVYRIDRKGDTYRLAVYDGGARRLAAPDRVLTGRREVEGSVGDIRYEFADGPRQAELIPYAASDDDTPLLTLTDSRGSRDIALAPAYWLDLLP